MTNPATLIVRVDRDRVPSMHRLRETVEGMTSLVDPDVDVDYIDGSPVTRQQALDAAAQLIHDDVRGRLSGEHGAYANGMRDLIFALFGADDFDEDAGRVYVGQEMQIRLRNLTT